MFFTMEFFNLTEQMRKEKKPIDVYTAAWVDQWGKGYTTINVYNVFLYIPFTD